MVGLKAKAFDFHPSLTSDPYLQDVDNSRPEFESHRISTVTSTIQDTFGTDIQGPAAYLALQVIDFVVDIKPPFNPFHHFMSNGQSSGIIWKLQVQKVSIIIKHSVLLPDKNSTLSSLPLDTLWPKVWRSRPDTLWNKLTTEQKKKLLSVLDHINKVHVPGWWFSDRKRELWSSIRAVPWQVIQMFGANDRGHLWFWWRWCWMTTS